MIEDRIDGGGPAAAVEDKRPGDMVRRADATWSARRWGWIAVGFGAWIVGGTFLVVRALNLGEATDVGVSPYHVVAYAALGAIGLLTVVRVVRARRDGRSWTSAYPAGFGALGAGACVLAAYVIADVAWREGVGVGLGIEGGFAPSRILLVIGLILVGGAALRAAVVLGDPALRWPAAVSSGIVLAALASPGGFHPAAEPWIERWSLPEPQSEVWVMDADGRSADPPDRGRG